MARPVVEVLVFVLVIITNTTQLITTVECGSKVRYLPGFEGPLPFHLETGYVGVGESENVQLFYYFVKSERSPQKDPLLLWLTGGPGCSAWSALVYENGPLRYKIQPYNGSLPSLILSQHSWTKASNVIYVDSPVGTGFSYGKTSSASKVGDLKQIRELTQFLGKWLNDHPEFRSNPIYIGGDSYSGMIVPVIVQRLAQDMEEGVFAPIDLQGYIIGNPKTLPILEQNYQIPFAHGMALISDELYKSLEKSCNGDYYGNVDPSNTECLNNIQAYEKSIAGISLEHILEPKCNLDIPKSRRRRLNEYSHFVDPILPDEPLPPINCKEFDYSLSGFWANNPDVRKALHIRKEVTTKWPRCNFDLEKAYEYEVDRSIISYHANLSAKGFRSLIHSGDHDMIVPFMSTQEWIRSLNYSIVDDWRPWLIEHQVAGYTRNYSNKMTFATVKGGGHTAPKYKTKECFAMFERWVDYQSL